MADKQAFVLYQVVKCPYCHVALENNGAMGFNARLTHQASGCRLGGKVFKPATVVLEEVSRGKVGLPSR